MAWRKSEKIIYDGMKPLETTIRLVMDARFPANVGEGRSVRKERVVFQVAVCGEEGTHTNTKEGLLVGVLPNSKMM